MARRVSDAARWLRPFSLVRVTAQTGNISQGKSAILIQSRMAQRCAFGLQV